MREVSVAPVVAINAGDNLTDPVWANARTHPESIQFLIAPGQAERGEASSAAEMTEITCAQFRDEVAALARGLIAAGVGPGDRVGLMSRTRYEWTLVDYAVWSCGAVTVPVYETSSAEQVAWILADSGAVACFAESAEHARTVRTVVQASVKVWTIDTGGIDRLVEGGAAIAEEEVEARRQSLGAEDVATIIYTSGTTGQPKGCVLTHRNLLADISNAIPEFDILFHEGATTLLFLPLAHAFARLLQLGAVQARVRIAFVPDVKNLIADFARVRPTFILGVPRIFEKIYNSARQKAHGEGKGRIFDAAEATAIAYSTALQTTGGPGLALRARHKLFDVLVFGKLRAALGGRCTAAISGGAPLGARLGHFYRGLGFSIFEGYGLTETSPAVTFNREGGTRIGTVGQPLPGVTVRIADDGEILVRGDIVFGEYWHNPQATADAIVDGWFHTGDLGSLDDDGFLSITGRKKEIIVTAGGKNVAPAVLEDRVRAHPLVSQCLVIGDGKPFIAALVTVDEEALPKWLEGQGRAMVDPAALREDPALRAEIQTAVDDANKAVSKAEAIRVFRLLPRDFTESTGELTPSLKVKRAVVMKEYSDEIEAIYPS